MTIQSKGGLTRPAIEDIVKGGFSTPWDAPTIPSFPFRFRNVEMMTLFYRSDRKAMEFLLPDPLQCTGDIVAIHIYRMNDTDWIGSFGESNIMFGASLPGVASGSYSPYFFLTTEVGVSHGREIHGQPKKLANVSLDFRGDLIVGTVERNGIDIITATLPYKQVACDPKEIAAYFDFSTNINLKAIDHIDGTPAIRQLTSRKLTDMTVHECWKGPCSVELRANVQAPIFRLPVIEPLHGFYWRADFSLIPGQVIHDYLADDKQAG